MDPDPTPDPNPTPDPDLTPDPTPLFRDFKDAKKTFFPPYYFLLTYPQAHFLQY
jgi:hypothetical protein